MIPWLSCFCQSSSKISLLFVLVLWFTPEYLWIFNPCSTWNVEEARRVSVLFPTDLGRLKETLLAGYIDNCCHFQSHLQGSLVSGTTMWQQGHTLYAPRSISDGRKQMSHTPVNMVLQPPLSTYHSSQTALYFGPPLLIIFAFFAFQFNLFFLFLLFSLFVFWTLLPLCEFNKLRLFCFYHLFYHSVVITWE